MLMETENAEEEYSLELGWQSGSWAWVACGLTRKKFKLARLEARAEPHS